MDTRADADSPDARRGRDAAATMAKEKGAAAIAEAMLPRLLAPGTLTAAPQVADRIRAVMAALPVAGIVGALAAMRDRADSTPLLPTLADVPTLAVVGEADEFTPPEQVRRMAEAIPGARLVVIPGAGHLPSVERPAATTRALQEFLQLLG